MELRKDPITRTWIHVGDQEPSEAVPAPCPYCQESDLAAAPIFRLSLEGQDGGRCATRVFPHPHPLYRIEEDPQRAAVGIYDRMGPIGAHEVIIETPDHNCPLWMAEAQAVALVLLTYAQRIEDLKRDFRFRYICVFKNVGTPAGQHIAHPHSELAATPFIPRRLLYELRTCREYYELKERCVFCDILQQELRQEVRLVDATPNFLALCPFAPRVPYEMWLLPRYHHASFESDLLRSSLGAELGGLLQRCLCRLINLAESFHMVLHTTPNTAATPAGGQKWSTLLDDYHWHLEVLPIVKTPTKSYSIKEVYYCPLSPERAAARLREMPTSVEALQAATRAS